MGEVTEFFGRSLARFLTKKIIFVGELGNELYCYLEL